MSSFPGEGLPSCVSLSQPALWDESRGAARVTPPPPPAQPPPATGEKPSLTGSEQASVGTLSKPPIPPSYCREKLLIALLCRGSTEAERLLGRGVNLGVLGVRGIESRGWMEETTREQLSLTISVERG